MSATRTSSSRRSRRGSPGPVSARGRPPEPHCAAQSLTASGAGSSALPFGVYGLDKVISLQADELREAFREYEEGTFVKVGSLPER